MIFEYLSCSKKCEVELVCRRWKSVSRSSQAIWRDGLFCEGAGVPESASSSKIMKGMLLRSGGTLHTAAFRISGSTILEANASRSMLQSISSAKVRNLWIDCGTRWHFTNTTGRTHQFPTSFSRAMRSATNLAVLKCDKITSLRVSTPNGTKSLTIVRGSPLAACRLDLLWLWSDSFDEFFSDGSGLKILRRLKYLQVRRAVPGGYAAGLPFLTGWKLLQECGKTLESAELELKSFSSIGADSYFLDVFTKLSPMDKKIVLPRLRHLRLISYNASAVTAQTRLDYFLHTPHLNRLYVEGSVPVESILSILESSVDSLTTLLLARSGFKFSDERQITARFCEALCNCRLLEDLTVMLDDTMLLSHIVRWLQQMKLRTLSIHLDDAKSGAAMYAFFSIVTKHSMQGLSHRSGRLVVMENVQVDDEIMNSFTLLSDSFEIVRLPSTITLSSQLIRLMALGNHSLLSVRANENCLDKTH